MALRAWRTRRPDDRPRRRAADRGETRQIQVRRAKPIDPAARRANTGGLGGHAEQTLRTLIRSLAARRGARTSRWRILEDAEAAVFKGRPRRARRILGPHLRRWPGDVDAWLLFVASRMGEGDHEQAVRDLEEVAPLVERTPVLAMLLSLSYARTGRLEEAARWVRVADADPEVAAKLREQPEISQVSEWTLEDGSPDDRSDPAYA